MFEISEVNGFVVLVDAGLFLTAELFNELRFFVIGFETFFGFVFIGEAADLLSVLLFSNTTPTF